MELGDRRRRVQSAVSEQRKRGSFLKGFKGLLQTLDLIKSGLLGVLTLPQFSGFLLWKGRLKIWMCLPLFGATSLHES